MRLDAFLTDYAHLISRLEAIAATTAFSPEAASELGDSLIELLAGPRCFYLRESVESLARLDARLRHLGPQLKELLRVDVDAFLGPEVPPALDLDVIEARAAAATEGPWVKGLWVGRCEKPHKHGNPTLTNDPCVYTYHLRDDSSVSYATPPRAIILEGAIGEQLTAADAAFIAHARSDVPDLIAEVRRLRAELLRRAAAPEREP